MSGILAEGSPERGLERLRMVSDLALIDETALVLVDELDRDPQS